MGAALSALGSLDSSNSVAIARVLADIRGLVAMIEDHSRGEHDFIHPLIARTSPQLVAELDAAHDTFAQTLENLQACATTLESSPSAERDDAALACYRALARFISNYYAHMEFEETRAAEAMFAAASDDEIRDTEYRLARRVGWPAVRDYLPLLLPPMARTERREFASTMRGAFPHEATVEAIMASARDVLDARSFAELRTDLGAGGAT